nr:hypothetical protein BaRGS_001911 [Batillaria attramentaria]
MMMEMRMMQILADFPGFRRIFTDGSKSEDGRVGAAAVMDELRKEDFAEQRNTFTRKVGLRKEDFAEQRNPFTCKVGHRKEDFAEQRNPFTCKVGLRKEDFAEQRSPFTCKVGTSGAV